MEVDPNLMTLGPLVALGLFLSLAYVAEKEPLLRWVVYVVVALFDLALLLAGAASLLAGVMPQLLGPEHGPAGLMEPEVAPMLAVLPHLSIVFITLGLVGFALLLPPVRHVVARLLPIEPTRVVHTAALHVALMLLASAGMIAAVMPVLAGNPDLLDEVAQQLAGQGALALLWVQNLGFVAVGLLGVGLFVRRDWREALDRLGVTRRVHVRLWLVVTLLGLASGYGIDWLWRRLQPESLDQVTRLSDAIFGPLLDAGLAGAITIALSAGIGEEILFRGAAQPRLGLVFTSLLFAATHTQYTVSLALVQMLIMGLLLGLVRRRANTTTSMAVHATYNFILVILAIYVPDLSP